MWMHYSKMNSNPKNKHPFLVPFNNLDSTSSTLLVDLTNEELDLLSTHALCSSGIALVMQRGKRYWTTIRTAASNVGVALVHGNIGKKRSSDTDDDLYAPIQEFFAEISTLADVRATKTVRTFTEIRAVGSDDGIVWLPSYFTFRNCYGRYMDGLGYEVEFCGSGSYRVHWKGADDAEQPRYVQMTTFYNIWKRDYPHVKVSRAVKDTCVLCYQLAHRHNFMIDHTCNSTADTCLFVDELDDDEEEPGEDCEEEEEEIDNRDNTVEKEPEVEPREIDVSESHDDDLNDYVDSATLDRERMLARANLHVKMADAQRMLYVLLVHKARVDSRLKKPHSQRCYTFVVDYGQNMELPIFNKEQPGCSYYYSPLSVYNLGMVDQGYEYNNEEVGDHMHAHVYHEGIGRKGANNVASLIVKTLMLKGLLRENDCGGELNNVFDNCSGQNKNNTVLRLLVWLTEMGYFKKVNFVFLIVGHTKNAADRIFNLLKLDYRSSNLYTMQQLMNALGRSKYVTIHNAVVGDFHDWGEYLKLFYSKFSKNNKGYMKQNHIFSCTFEENRTGNNLLVHIRQSDLPEHTILAHKAFKVGFFGRSEFQKGDKGLNKPFLLENA